MRSIDDFWRLVELGRRLRRQGWTQGQLKSRSQALEKTFSAGGRDWILRLYPHLYSRRAQLEVMVSPEPAARSKDWRNLERSTFCRALNRRMQQLRFRNILGPKSGGRILFFKPIRSHSAISENWEKLSAIDFTSLGRRPIPDSPPVPLPAKEMNQLLCDRMFRDLAMDCRKGKQRPIHHTVQLFHRQRASGQLWTVCAYIYWHSDPTKIDPPSEIWASLLIYPPDDLSRKEEADLRASGFYEAVTRDLGRLGLKGSWQTSPSGRFGNFDRLRLRWKDVPRLCGDLQAWSVARAIADSR